jgi:hypothetical protein
MSDIVHILESVQMNDSTDLMMCGAVIHFKEVDNTTLPAPYINQWRATRDPDRITCPECSDILALELLGDVG